MRIEGVARCLGSYTSEDKEVEGKIQTCRLDWNIPHVTQFFQPREFFYQFICNVCNNKKTTGVPIAFPETARFRSVLTKRTRKCFGLIARKCVQIQIVLEHAQRE